MKNILIIFTLLGLMAFTFQQEEDETTIFLVGDSTMANKPYRDGNPEHGWGQVFGLFLKDGYRVENHAVNGRSSRSFRSEGRWDVVMERMKPGDYVIIQFGHNDQKIKDSTRYSAPETDYRAHLTRFVAEVRAGGGNPILATPIKRRRFDENGEFYGTHGEYPRVVREVAEATEVPMLDLQVLTRQLLIAYGEENSKKLFLFIEPGKYPSLPDGREDNTHLSAVGAFRVSDDLAKQEIMARVPGLKEAFKD